MTVGDHFGVRGEGGKKAIFQVLHYGRTDKKHDKISIWSDRKKNRGFFRFDDQNTIKQSLSVSVSVLVWTLAKSTRTVKKDSFKAICVGVRVRLGVNTFVWSLWWNGKKQSSKFFMTDGWKNDKISTWSDRQKLSFFFWNFSRLMIKIGYNTTIILFIC